MDRYTIKEEECKISKWSGGITKELFIFPKGASLKEQDFLIRISSAEVELEESTFTFFPKHERILMVLKGEIKVHHKFPEGIEIHKLSPFMQSYFPGDVETKSFGTCTDYNVITKKGIKSELRQFQNGVINVDKNTIYHIYAINPISLTLKDQEKNIRLKLKKGSSYVIEKGQGKLYIESENNEINSLVTSCLID